MTVDPKTLTGEARQRFDVWRTLGLSEAAAIEELRRDGMLTEAQHDGFDGTVRTFQSLFGLSESAARTAAIGRDGTEREARRDARAAAHAPSTAELNRRERERVVERERQAERLERSERLNREVREAFDQYGDQLTDDDWAELAEKFVPGYKRPAKKGPARPSSSTRITERGRRLPPGQGR